MKLKYVFNEVKYLTGVFVQLTLPWGFRQYFRNPDLTGTNQFLIGTGLIF